MDLTEKVYLLLVQTMYNLLIFFSDPPNGEEWQALDDGLAYGTDMVRHIRHEFGDCFTVCVAGEDKMILFLTNHACFIPENFNTSPTKECFCKTHTPTLEILIKLHSFL